MAAMKTMIIVLSVAAAAVALSACGDSASDGSTAAAADRNRDALLKFARCMREQGLDFPDPVVSEDGGEVRMRAAPAAGTRLSAEKLRAAEAACAKYREAVTPPKISEEERAKMREQALAHARCMREQGLDFPDPQFEGGGRMTQRVGGDGADPDDSKFRAAMEKCRKKLGGGGAFSVSPAGAP